MKKIAAFFVMLIVMATVDVCVNAEDLAFVTNETLPQANANVDYSTTIEATGGTAPYTFELVNPNYCPAGITLSPSGVYSGKPTKGGLTYPNIDIRVTDSSSTPVSVIKRFSLSVYARTITFVIGENNFTFDGTPHTVTATPYVDGNDASDIIKDYTVTVGNAENQTNVGSYQIRVNVTAPGYSLGSLSKYRMFINQNSNVNINFANTVFPYDNTPKSPTVTVTGKPTPSSEAQNLSHTLMYEGVNNSYNSSTAPTNPGIYRLTCTVTNPNYTTPNENSVLFEIEHTSVDFELDDTSPYYHGNTWGRTYTPSIAGVKYTVKYVNTTTGVESDTPTDIGIYRAKITIDPSDTDMYEVGTISPATVTVLGHGVNFTVSDNSKTYTGEALEPNITNDMGLVNRTDYTVVYKNSNGDIVSGKPVAVGSYTIEIDLAHPEDYSNVTILPNTFEITKKDINLTLNNDNTVYTGLEILPDVTCDVEGVAFSVKCLDEHSAEVSPVNADTYSLNITLTGADAENYNIVTKPDTYTIVKKEITISADKTSIEFDGAEHTPVITITPTITDTYTVAYHKQGDAETNMTLTIKDVGVYDMIVNIANGDNYVISDESDKTITITAKQVNISIGNKTATYNENPHGVSDLNITATPATAGAYTVKFRKIGESGEGAISVTDAGTYDILFTPADGYNLTGDTTNQQFVISKRDIHFTVSPATHEYDSNTVTPTVTPDLSGFSAYTYKIEKDSVEVSTIQNAGTYNIVVNLTDSDNNNAVMTNNSIVITPANVTFTVTNNIANYDGSAHKATINTDLSLTEGTDYEVKYVKEGVKTDDATGVGEYTIEITMKNPNYTTAYTPQTMTVNGVAVTFTVTNNIANYDGSAHKATISSDPSLTEGTQYEVKYVKDGIETDDVTNAGEYDIKVTILDSNYSLAAAVTDKMTVTPKTINFTVGDNTYSYDGAYHQATITPSEIVPEGTYSVKYDNGTAQSDSVKDSGTYTIEITSENGNYVIGTISDSTMTITDSVFLVIGNSPAAMIFADSAHAEDTDENKIWRETALADLKTNKKFSKGYVPEGCNENVIYTDINNIDTVQLDGDKNTFIIKSITASEIQANTLTADPGLSVNGEIHKGNLAAVEGVEGLYKITYTHGSDIYERYVMVVRSKIGDANGSGTTNAVDAAKYDEITADRAASGVTEARVWDVNKDGMVGIDDSSAIVNRFKTRLIPYYSWIQ